MILGWMSVSSTFSKWDRTDIYVFLILPSDIKWLFICSTFSPVTWSRWVYMFQDMDWMSVYSIFLACDMECMCLCSYFLTVTWMMEWICVYIIFSPVNGTGVLMWSTFSAATWSRCVCMFHFLLGDMEQMSMCSAFSPVIWSVCP